MSDPSLTERCPTCAAALPANAPQGLCPKWLLERAAAPTDSGVGEASRIEGAQPQPR